MKWRMILTLVAAILSMGALTVTTGCDNDGPMENAGENLDNAGDDVGDGLEDMGDDIGDGLDDAGDNVEDTFD